MGILTMMRQRFLSNYKKIKSYMRTWHDSVVFCVSLATSISFSLEWRKFIYYDYVAQYAKRNTNPFRLLSFSSLPHIQFFFCLFIVACSFLNLNCALLVLRCKRISRTRWFSLTQKKIVLMCVLSVSFFCLSRLFWLHTIYWVTYLKYTSREWHRSLCILSHTTQWLNAMR